MTDATSLLPALKIDLRISTDAFDARLKEYLQNATAAITREGAELTDSAEDKMLVVQYAAWTWRRRDTGEAMPRMIRWALNNRIFGQHMEGA